MMYVLECHLRYAHSPKPLRYPAKETYFIGKKIFQKRNKTNFVHRNLSLFDDLGEAN